MKSFILISALILTLSVILKAQIPVTVTRSRINAGEGVVLPFSGKSSVGLIQGESTVSFSSGGFADSGGDPQGNLNSISGICIGSPSTLTRTLPANNGNVQSFEVLLFGNPVITLSKSVPSSFTNSISGTGIWSSDRDHQATLQNTYTFTVVEEAGSQADEITLSGQVDFLSSVSRNSIDTTPRKLVGFQLKSSTSATVKNMAFLLSNTSTNQVLNNNFTNIQLVKDVDGGNEFDSGDTIIATTTNANGFAIFTDLNVPVTTSNQTFFLTVSFSPKDQSKNSFISASLNPQNIIAVSASDVPVPVVGSTVLGEQYAFLDNTADEELAYSENLKSEITNFVQSQVSPSNLSQAKNDFDSLDAIIPACVAGVAGVTAAYCYDSLDKNTTSTEFSTVKP